MKSLSQMQLYVFILLVRSKKKNITERQKLAKHNCGTLICRMQFLGFEGKKRIINVQ